ncbi:MAG: DEAD/DEAH box helicase [Polyangiaceae bacterium]
MPIHPIAVVEPVIEEYKEHFATEFRARDERLRNELRGALETDGFLAGPAFFQAYRPFKDGRPWRDLGLDARLAAVLEERSSCKTAFLHQGDAIGHLLGPSASHLAVTTGTGSGRTECFLVPVLQNAIEDAALFKRDGLTAILVYPMNALAGDQEKRIKDYLERFGHAAIRFARYDRTTSQSERAELRKNPPHLLLTNYMMLESRLAHGISRGVRSISTRRGADACQPRPCSVFQGYLPRRLSVLRPWGVYDSASPAKRADRSERVRKVQPRRGDLGSSCRPAGLAVAHPQRRWRARMALGGASAR